MAITTYTELKTAVADFLNRDDLTSVAPTFISLAETDMQRRIRHWRMEKRSTAEIDTQYSAIPADFLEVIRFYITSGDTKPLELISQAELLDRKRKNLNTSGSPSYYAITAGEIEVYPIPDGTYTAELYYYSSIQSQSASNATNWLLDNHKDAYLYGALVHSAPYLKDDARIQMWAALYQSADSPRCFIGGLGGNGKSRLPLNKCHKD
ncbi:MAG: hypothetical protein O2910_02430 [Proteobacteria bacterium]|nr:hypothetical protein [Pseudomonadota bacterium]MDA1287013.1 hypothetical protein [Pseudomonadota bacterium]